jgi:MFS transporter, MHS family, proline/betaine transporter
MRPVGGILLGIYADRRGRKAALLLVVGLMTVAIALIGFAPTYAAIGIAAPIVIVLARLLQGFSAGGEFASATSFLIESAPAGQRGYYGSWQMVGQGLAVLFGALFGTLLTRTLTPDALNSWGWRIPFLFGLIIGPLGLFIRRRLDETSVFLATKQKSELRPALGAAVASHTKEALVCVGIVIAGTISFYIILLYMPTFARVQLHLALDQVFFAQSVSLACTVVLTPISGIVSDRIGRKPVVMSALILYLVLTYPLFAWMSANPSLTSLMVTQIALCSVVGILFGPMATVVAEQFPAHIRSTGLGLSYNIAVMVFGGFAPFFVTWLIQTTGSPVAPAFYVMFGAAVGLLAAFFLKEPVGETDPAISGAMPA